MSFDLRESLASGCAALGLALEPAQQNQIVGYAELLLKWNRVYNLSAASDAQTLLTHHLLDCLAVVAPLRRELAQLPRPQPGALQRLLDLGAGAGLPGALLAIAMPALEVCCLDAVQKKTAFVQQAAAQLGLKNLSAHHGRAQAWAGPAFDVVSARAVAELSELVAWTQPLLAPHGLWLAMKGKPPQQELEALQGLQGLQAQPLPKIAAHVEPLTVPGLNAQRCIAWLRREASVTPAGLGEI